jgi:two-component system uhpT operon response regulator UhpA
VESRNGSAWFRCDDAEVNAIRLAIVDDHPAIGLAIQAAVAAEQPVPDSAQEIRIVGVARTAAQGTELVSRSDHDAPDVILCDIQLQAGTDGLGVVAAAVKAGHRAIVLTSFDRSSLMRAAFDRGASGFLSKGAEMAAILQAVRTVAGGGTSFSAAALDSARFGPRPPSEREIGVLGELQLGATSEEIGARLAISPRTVESHLRRMFDRYGVVSRTELAVLAIREGWIDKDPG